MKRYATKRGVLLLFFVVLAVSLAFVDWREIAAEAVFTIVVAIVIGIGLPAAIFVPMFIWHYAKLRSVTIALRNTWRVSKSFLLSVLDGL